jgi:hypothetical protein
MKRCRLDRLCWLGAVLFLARSSPVESSFVASSSTPKVLFAQNDCSTTTLFAEKNGSKHSEQRSHTFRSKSKSSASSSSSSSDRHPSHSSSSTELNGAFADAMSDVRFKIFCDLDGVLVDFDHGIRQLMGCRPEECIKGTMWGKVARAKNFYGQLEWTADGKRLWNAIRPLKPDILTGVPKPKKHCTDKFEWCRRELGLDELHHVDMAAGYKSHEVVNDNYPREDVTNVITCWSNNKPIESSYRT